MIVNFYSCVCKQVYCHCRLYSKTNAEGDLDALAVDDVGGGGDEGCVDGGVDGGVDGNGGGGDSDLDGGVGGDADIGVDGADGNVGADGGDGADGPEVMGLLSSHSSADPGLEQQPG